MIISCEKCQTQFQLADERLPKKGARVRCSKCKHSFFVAHPEAAAEAPEPVAPAPPPEVAASPAPDPQGPEAHSAPESAFEEPAFEEPAGPPPAEDGSSAPSEGEMGDWGFNEEELPPTPLPQQASGWQVDEPTPELMEREPPQPPPESAPPPELEPSPELEPAPEPEPAPALESSPELESPPDSQAGEDAPGGEFEDLFAGSGGDLSGSGLEIDTTSAAPGESEEAHASPPEEEASSGGSPEPDLESPAGEVLGSSDVDLEGFEDESGGDDVSMDSLEGDLASLEGDLASLEEDLDSSNEGLGSPEDWDFFGGDEGGLDSQEGLDSSPVPQADSTKAIDSIAGSLEEPGGRPRDTTAPIVVGDIEKTQLMPQWVGLSAAVVGWCVVAGMVLMIVMKSMTPAERLSEPQEGMLKIGSLVAEGVRGRMVENATSGTIYVVSGSLRNASETDAAAESAIRVVLIDKQGEGIKAAQVLAGFSLPEHRIREDEPEKLTQRLKEDAAELAWTELEAKEAVTFAAVFAELPDEAVGFRLQTEEIAKPENQFDDSWMDPPPATAGEGGLFEGLPGAGELLPSEESTEPLPGAENAAPSPGSENPELLPGSENPELLPGSENPELLPGSENPGGSPPGSAPLAADVASPDVAEAH